MKTEFNEDYLIERFKRGSAAGFTFQQCCFHYLIDLALGLGSSKEDILRNLGPDTGYIFPDECPPTST